MPAKFGSDASRMDGSSSNPAVAVTLVKRYRQKNVVRLRPAVFNPFQGGEVGRHHSETAPISCCVLPHFMGGSIRFFQIACCADYLGSMRGERTRGLHSETRRNTCNENSLAFEIYSRQNLICC